jgi:hypothetical protein
MAQYDKDEDITIHPPSTGKNIDKPKGQMSIRDAAAMEMPTQQLETGVPGTAVHGFGDGQADTVKHHTTPTADMTMGMQQRSAAESVTEVVELIFQLPFHAQLGVMRMIAPRILGAMDARDRENFMSTLRSELSAEGTEASPMNTPDIQGT